MTERELQMLWCDRTRKDLQARLIPLWLYAAAAVSGVAAYLVALLVLSGRPL